MQCLYCETELKPLRGLFDEDFCSKEHREKYFASFRKGIHLLPSLDLPPIEQKAVEAVIEETAEPALTLVIDEALEIEAVSEPEAEIAAVTPQVPAVEHPRITAAAVEATLEEDVSKRAGANPRHADFLQVDVAPSGTEDCYFMIEEGTFSACNGPAIPDVEVFCDAALDPEDGVAYLTAPVEIAAADGQFRRADSPGPHVAAALAPSFKGWDYTAPAVTLLEPAELIEDVEMFVAGVASPEMARSIDGHAIAWGSTPVLPNLAVSLAGSAGPLTAEAAVPEIAPVEIDSDPLMFSDFAPALEFSRPVFQVSAAAMELEEDLKRAVEVPAEAVQLAEPEIARPAAMSAAPASHAMPVAAFQPAMPVPARSDAQLNVPAMSSKTEAIPSVAPEAIPDAPRGVGTEQPPAAHSSEPVQPEIQSSVRIKNWRLKITFAKPA